MLIALEFAGHVNVLHTLDGVGVKQTSLVLLSYLAKPLAPVIYYKKMKHNTRVKDEEKKKEKEV
jgi:hypothetical protein